MKTVQSTRRRRAWWGLLTLLLLALAAGYALSSSPSVPTATPKPSASPSAVVLAPAAATNGNAGTNDNCVVPSNGNGNCVKTFGVTVGAAATLYPSLVRQVPVSYSNPNSFDISVTTYRVSVSVPPAQSTTCPASSLQVPAGTVTLSPALTAPRNGTVSTTIPVKLPADAPPGCQKVTFTITVNASAVKK